MPTFESCESCGAESVTGPLCFACLPDDAETISESEALATCPQCWKHSLHSIMVPADGRPALSECAHCGHVRDWVSA